MKHDAKVLDSTQIYLASLNLLPGAIFVFNVTLNLPAKPSQNLISLIQSYIDAWSWVGALDLCIQTPKLVRQTLVPSSIFSV